MNEIRYTVPTHPNWEGKVFGYFKVESFSHQGKMYGNFWNTVYTCCGEKSVRRTSELIRFSNNKCCRKCFLREREELTTTRLLYPSPAIELARQDFYLGKPIRSIED